MFVEEHLSIAENFIVTCEFTLENVLTSAIFVAKLSSNLVSWLFICAHTLVKNLINATMKDVVKDLLVASN